MRQYRTQGFSILMLVAGTLLVSGCGGGGGGGDDGDDGAGGDTVSFDARTVIDNEADTVITGTYRDLNAAAAVLLAAVQALRDGGATELELDLAQTAWKTARVPWESSEGFLFGPVDAAAVDPAIDSWPLNTPDLKAFLAQNPAATVQDVQNAGDDLRGFHAMEWLLFGLDDDGALNNEMSATALGVSELNYLVALAEAFKAQTQLLEDAWVKDFNNQGPFATTFKARPQSAAMQELINGLITIADEIGNAKIAEPLGSSISDADTTLVESQYSWNSLTDFHNNVQSILNVYSGKVGYDPMVEGISDTLNGLYAFVLAHDPLLADRVLAEIIDAQQKIALIKGDGDPTTTQITGTAQPFRNQIRSVQGRVLIEDAVAALNVLQDTLDQDVSPLVGQTQFAP